MLTSSQKGSVAETAVIHAAALAGVGVYKPITEGERADLIFNLGGRSLKVQCKWGSLRNGVINIRLSTSRHTPNGYVKTTYRAEEIDLVAAYCPDVGLCYLIPPELALDRNMVCLRLRPCGNSQVAGVHWAADYEFSGAVAQLEERCHGMAEARGSSPLSSITPEPLEEPTVVAGAHEFRNRFGYYMELATAGTEICVTHRGRPRVRLVADQPRLAAV